MPRDSPGSANAEDRCGGAILVPQPSEERLDQRQILDYCAHRRRLIQGMAHKGKDEKRAKGYAETMVRRRAGNLDAFYRSVWDGEGGYREGFETPNPDADG